MGHFLLGLLKTLSLWVQIIETAKENNLDPYKYLAYIFKEFPNSENPEDEDFVNKLLPWNAPDECKVNK